jgi:hypothetical protein
MTLLSFSCPDLLETELVAIPSGLTFNCGEFAGIKIEFVAVQPGQLSEPLEFEGIGMRIFGTDVRETVPV